MNKKLIALAALAMASTGAMAGDSADQNFTASVTVPTLCLVTDGADLVGELVTGGASNLTAFSDDKLGSMEISANTDVTYKLTTSATTAATSDNTALEVNNTTTWADGEINFVSKVGAAGTLEVISGATTGKAITLDTGKATLFIGAGTNLPTSALKTGVNEATTTVTFTCADA